MALIFKNVPEYRRLIRLRWAATTAVLNAEGFALALDRIYQVAQKVDDKTMSLQYLEMMKQLASGTSTKWIIPMEMTSFVQNFARNISSSSSASNGALSESR